MLHAHIPESCMYIYIHCICIWNIWIPFCLTANIPKQSPIDVDDCWWASTMDVMVFLAFFVDICVVSSGSAMLALVPTLNVLSSTASAQITRSPIHSDFDHPNQVFKTGVSGDQRRSMFMSIVFLKSRVGLSLHSSLELPVSLLTFAASTTPKMHHLAQNPGNGNGGNYDKVWHLHSQVNRIPMHTEVHYWRVVAFAHELAVSLRLIMTCHSIWQGGDPTQALTRWARRDSTGINLHLMVGPWERAHHPGKPQSHMVMGGEKGGLIEVT